MGVKIIVVLIHDGGYQDGLYNKSLNMSGSILDVVKHTDRAVDVFITVHTHQVYNVLIDGRIVTEAYAQGNCIHRHRSSDQQRDSCCDREKGQKHYSVQRCS
jgi:5'-nucleotidase